MRYMNDAKVEEAVEFWRDHPLLGPATATLKSMKDAVNAYGQMDWSEWRKPMYAAAKLVRVIERDGHKKWRILTRRNDVTEEEVFEALADIEFFRSSVPFDFTIYYPKDLQPCNIATAH